MLDILDLPDRLVLSINRPQKQSALDLQLSRRLDEQVRAAAAAAKPLVITSSHARMFSAGVDLEDLAARGMPSSTGSSIR